MEYITEYGYAFIALAKRMEISFPDTPYHAINTWKELLDIMKDGYTGIHPELTYDLLRVREPIETFLVDPELNLFQDHREFINRINQLDEELLRISIEIPQWKEKSNDFRWWQSRVLKFGSKTYTDFMNAHLPMDWNITVEVL